MYTLHLLIQLICFLFQGDFFHIQEGFKFESIPELLYYYYENNLPNYDFTLKRPYSQPKD